MQDFGDRYQEGNYRLYKKFGGKTRWMERYPVTGTILANGEPPSGSITTLNYFFVK
jgi:hypothetical protein